MIHADRRPQALVIGPKKAGTTWIQDYMRTRSDVCLPKDVKETFFFDRNWEKGVSWYENHFLCRLAPEISLRLEIGPSYFHHPEAPQRVYETLGIIPLLVTLRDPVQRAWSNYLHLRRYGRTKARLKEAAVDFPEIIEASRYRTCLVRWNKFFPRQNIHFVWQEMLMHSPDEYALRTCTALGISYCAVTEKLQGRSNEAAVPVSYALAAAGSRTADQLRSRGLYKVVNVAKRLGLKRVFFGKPGSARDIKPLPHELAWLKEQLIDEIPVEAEAARGTHYRRSM